MKFNASTVDLQVIPLHVEDGKEVNVLVSKKVSPDEKPGVIGPHSTIIANPVMQEVIRVEFCVATDEGFEYPQYTPTNEQMALFKEFAKECE